ncbi:MAG: GntR family transcriptional regulator [Verrucomicrobiota bacterium]
MSDRLVSINLSELAYARIKKMIAEHRFSPGARINVEELTRRFGASRTPIWEAIRRLEQEGLVRNVPNRGVFLVELTREAAVELYAVREVLEGMAARLAVRGVTGRMLERMEESLREQEKVTASESLVGFSRADFVFHSVVYAACGNAVLKEMLEIIKNRARPLAMQITPILPELLEDHREIVRALRLRDPDLAEAAFRNHNRRVLALLLSEPEAPPAPESKTTT